MLIYTIEFSPPMAGFDGRFNTFRVGGAWAKRLKPGDTVLLLDKKSCQVFGQAVVEAVHTGKMREMCEQHGAQNHNQRGLSPIGAGQRVAEAIMKRYGPHIVNDTKTVTVIYLRRTE